MPTFFRFNQLTEEQKANWDDAIKKYSKIMEMNALRELKSMTENNKKEFMALGVYPIKNFTDEDVLKKLREMAMIMGNPPGDEKSALFFRLLSGKRVFKNAPPVSYSYPDYELVESNEARELMLDIFDVNSMIQKPEKYVRYKHISINQTPWKVVEVVSPIKVKLTHPRWEKDGFIWELTLSELSAEESQSAIICHHDPSNGKITTYETLVKEAHWQAQQHFYKLKLAQEEKEYEKHEQKLAEKDKGLGWGFYKTFAKNDLEHGKAMLADRMAKGLPPEPTEEEIQEYVNESVKGYLSRDYFVKDGLLFKKVWMMKRVFPVALTDDHYISEEEFNECEVKI